LNTPCFDQGINSIKYVKMTKQGVVITIENFEKMPNCFRYKPEKWWSTKSEIPVEIWQKYLWKFKQNTTEEIENSDPDHAFLIVMNQITYGQQQKGY
jgi:hypothetical protein